ncbi:sushi, von Willebrand factor type A, EGF and pentraxin domain-containing protein 1-like [Porites lutea]|uniref:sushi, von Willebrand factor type A, EGF and pentraxin domain-containing protein 1-like n=1 Tax=Porites lutea TaxID=51062 RepID=UPI003CC5926C
MKATLLSFVVLFLVVDQFAPLITGTCPLYSPPTNGALVCNYIGSYPTCQVQCKQGYDFEFTPPFAYYCSGGNWHMFSIGPYDPKLPWPSCKKTVNPNNLWLRNFPFFYFPGDCKDTNKAASVKDNFLNLMNNGPVLPLFCKSNPLECNKNTVQAYFGDVTAEKRRRKRIAVKLESQQGKKVNKVTNA